MSKANHETKNQIKEKQEVSALEEKQKKTRNLSQFSLKVAQLPLWQKISLVFISTILITCLSFFLWTIIGHHGPDQTAKQALKSTPEVQVQTDKNGNLTFTPLTSPNGQGVIFYSGALVEPASYAPLFQLFAQDGYLVIAPKFNFDLAPTNPEIATQLIASYPEITTWTGIGHSLGGVSLSDYAAAHPTAFKNIILLGAYPNSPAFNQVPSKVASVIGDQDQLVNRKKYTQARSLLPQSAALVTIPGANHAQYGNYGSQRGDGQATITPAQQQISTLETLQILSGRYHQEPGSELTLPPATPVPIPSSNR